MRAFSREIKFFSNTVRVKRYELNLTLEEMAEKIGCHPNALGRLERGQAVPNYLTIIKIARALKVSPKSFMPD